MIRVRRKEGARHPEKMPGGATIDAVLLIAFLAREIAYAAGYEPPLIGDALEQSLDGPADRGQVTDLAAAEVVETMR